MRKLGLCTAGFVAAFAISSLQPAFALDPRPGVKVRALEKITGKAIDIEIELDETVKFGGLGLTVRACHQSPPEEQPPESAAYLEVITMGVNEETGSAKDDDPRLFSGWMFASSPGLNGLEHSLYDVWVISCSAALPVIEEEPLKLYDESGLGFDNEASNAVSSPDGLSEEGRSAAEAIPVTEEDTGFEFDPEPIFVEPESVKPAGNPAESSFLDNISIPKSSREEGIVETEDVSEPAELRSTTE